MPANEMSAPFLLEQSEVKPSLHALEPLNLDELAAAIEALEIEGHKPRDFEPKCPGCTAARKLKAMRDASLCAATSVATLGSTS